MTTNLRLGTRGSALARWQADFVRSHLEAAWPSVQFEIVPITTRGDQILDTPLPLLGGKGLFTAELEQALHEHRIDFAVHSLKDLPTEMPDGLVLGATMARANPLDVLVSRSQQPLAALPIGATIGTSSRRRAAQLRYHRPDIAIADIRGNVDTRIRKTLDPAGPYDATVLAYAGLERIGRLEVVAEILTLMLPAPGQGALAIQCRPASAYWVVPLHDTVTAAAVTAERAFLSGLGGGCAVPIAAYARLEAGRLCLQGRVTANDGSQQIDIEGATDDLQNAAALGTHLARLARQQGADAILELDNDTR